MLVIVDIYLVLNIPSTLHIAISEKLLVVIEEVYICPKSATLPPITQVTMVDFFIYLLLLIVFIKFFMTMNYVILGVIIKCVKAGLKIPDKLPFTIMDKVLLVEVDIDIRNTPLNPIIQGILVDCFFFCSCS